MTMSLVSAETVCCGLEGSVAVHLYILESAAVRLCILRLPYPTTSVRAAGNAVPSTERKGSSQYTSLWSV